MDHLLFKKEAEIDASSRSVSEDQYIPGKEAKDYVSSLMDPKERKRMLSRECQRKFRRRQKDQRLREQEKIRMLGEQLAKAQEKIKMQDERLEEKQEKVTVLGEQVAEAQEKIKIQDERLAEAQKFEVRKKELVRENQILREQAKFLESRIQTLQKNAGLFRDDPNSLHRKSDQQTAGDATLGSHNVQSGHDNAGAPSLLFNRPSSLYFRQNAPISPISPMDGGPAKLSGQYLRFWHTLPPKKLPSSHSS